MVRTITVAKMGTSGTKVEINGILTYRAVVELAGISSFKALMADGRGYVNGDDILADNVTTIIISAPKFEAGALKIVDDEGNEYVEVTPGEFIPKEDLEEESDIDINIQIDINITDDDDEEEFFDDDDDDDVRIVTVAKMGTAGTPVEVTGIVTYRHVVELAGISTFKALMADGRGYVNADDILADNVTTIIISAPKFEAGALPAGLRIVDDNGVEYAPVAEATEIESEPSTRFVTVAKMGTAGVKVEIIGVMTYRAVAEEAGFEAFKALMADGVGYVNPDDILAASVSTIVLSAPKFEAGALPAGLRIVDDNGVEYAPVAAAAAEPETSARFVTVAKMGTAGIKVEIVGVMTYRAVVEEAGIESFKALMADGVGYVNPDDILAASVSTIVLSAPKFEAGL